MPPFVGSRLYLLRRGRWLSILCVGRVLVPWATAWGWRTSGGRFALLRTTCGLRVFPSIPAVLGCSSPILHARATFCFLYHATGIILYLPLFGHHPLRPSLTWPITGVMPASSTATCDLPVRLDMFSCVPALLRRNIDCWTTPLRAPVRLLRHALRTGRKSLGVWTGLNVRNGGGAGVTCCRMRALLPVTSPWRARVSFCALHCPALSPALPPRGLRRQRFHPAETRRSHATVPGATACAVSLVSRVLLRRPTFRVLRVSLPFTAAWRDIHAHIGSTMLATAVFHQLCPISAFIYPVPPFLLSAGLGWNDGSAGLLPFCPACCACLSPPSLLPLPSAMARASIFSHPALSALISCGRGLVSSGVSCSVPHAVLRPALRPAFCAGAFILSCWTLSSSACGRCSDFL